MTEKHTLGPLILTDDGSPTYLDGCQAQYYIDDRDGRTIAFVKDAEYANLFAAAPDLLEALQKFVTTRSVAKSLAPALDAIAKATGGAA